MKNEYQNTMEEIKTMVQEAQESDAEDDRNVQEARQRYEQAMNKKQAALDAGDKEQYRVAGMEVEVSRIDLEYCEKHRDMKKTPGASITDDKRINGVLKMEAQHTYTDALAQLQQIFTEAVDVCTSALDKMTEIDAASKKWDSFVMRKNKADPISKDQYRLSLSQFRNAMNGMLERFKYIN